MLKSEKGELQVNYRKHYKTQLLKLKARCHRIELCRKGLRELWLHYMRDDGMFRRIMPPKPVLPDELNQKLVSVTKA